jgi:hypothetical protein
VIVDISERLLTFAAVPRRCRSGERAPVNDEDIAVRIELDVRIEGDGKCDGTGRVTDLAHK